MPWDDDGMAVVFADEGGVRCVPRVLPAMMVRYAGSIGPRTTLLLQAFGPGRARKDNRGKGTTQRGVLRSSLWSPSIGRSAALSGLLTGSPARGVTHHIPDGTYFLHSRFTNSGSGLCGWSFETRPAPGDDSVWRPSASSPCNVSPSSAMSALGRLWVQWFVGSSGVPWRAEVWVGTEEHTTTANKRQNDDSRLPKHNHSSLELHNVRTQEAVHVTVTLRREPKLDKNLRRRFATRVPGYKNIISNF